ncbi:MAG TPA: hypothetical protein PLI22_03045 [Caldisericia bacterium]|nr:hypothetical protein [Caldisericia bacterium]
MWKECRLAPDDLLLQFLLDQTRQTTSADTEKIFSIRNNKNNQIEKYKICFDWQEENICGIDIFKEIS